MQCDICGIREATVHLTEVINENVTKLHLCDECAKEKSEEMQSHFGLTDLLSGLMDMEPSISDEGDGTVFKIKCPECGMTYCDFQKSGRLGCGKCFEAFEKNLSELLIKIHGSDKHVGKMPFRGKDTLEEQKDIKRLRTELNKLIRNEEFEKAALLRDRLRDLEEKLR